MSFLISILILRAVGCLAPGAGLCFTARNPHFLGLDLEVYVQCHWPRSVLPCSTHQSSSSIRTEQEKNKCPVSSSRLFLPVALPPRQESYDKISPSGPVSTCFLPPPHSTGWGQRHRHIDLGNYPPNVPLHTTS